MKGELEDHLREALRDGKTVDEVTGGDVGAFAGAWAVEDRPTMTLRERVMEWAWMLAMSAIFVSVFGHLWYFAPNYFIEAWSWYLTPVFFTLSAGMFEMPGVPWKNQESSAARIIISIGTGVAAGIAMACINVAVHLGETSSIFDWSWISTLLVVLLGAPLMKNRRRTNVMPILEERDRSESEGPAG